MRYLWISLAIVFIALTLWLQALNAGPRTRASTQDEVETRIHDLFDTWHAAAAAGDYDAYFGRMTKDAVFLGTDQTERWVGDEFRDWARPHFDGEEAWTYHPTDRHIAFGPGGTGSGVAWIDETLTHDRYGTLRGTGIAVYTERADRWSITHYSMTFLVPNDIACEVVARIKQHDAIPPTPSDP